jgi:hypothetical protein
VWWDPVNIHSHNSHRLEQHSQCRLSPRKTRVEETDTRDDEPYKIRHDHQVDVMELQTLVLEIDIFYIRISSITFRLVKHGLRELVNEHFRLCFKYSRLEAPPSCQNQLVQNASRRPLRSTERSAGGPKFIYQLQALPCSRQFQRRYARTLASELISTHPSCAPKLLGTTTLGTDKQCGVSAIAVSLAERAAEQFGCTAGGVTSQGKAKDPNTPNTC